MMSNKKWLGAVALLGLSASALADGTYEFDSITQLKHDALSITGVLVNDTVPTTLTLTSGTSGQCLEWQQLMMTQPGAFTLTVTITTTTNGPPTFTAITACTLTAKP